jgi:hypothetical protein
MQPPFPSCAMHWHEHETRTHRAPSGGQAVCPTRQPGSVQGKRRCEPLPQHGPPPQGKKQGQARSGRPRRLNTPPPLILILMKIPILIASAACSLLMVSCKDKSGERVPPRAPSPDGTNTSSSGVQNPGESTPPSTTSGVKGTGAGVDAPDNPEQAKPPAVQQPTSGSGTTPNPPPPQ